MDNPFHQLLDSIREATTTEADKGKRFEVLIKRFLQAEPTYKERFSDVWLWTEWPYRMGKGDVGLDLVARESVSGHYVAIQCKCYDNGHVVSEKDLETFFLAAGSTWTTDKDSGIVNDPNLWCEEHRDPKYIINLLLRVVTVSVETVKIVKGLPLLGI